MMEEEEHEQETDDSESSGEADAGVYDRIDWRAGMASRSGSTSHNAIDPILPLINNVRNNGLILLLGAAGMYTS